MPAAPKAICGCATISIRPVVSISLPNYKLCATGNAPITNLITCPLIGITSGARSPNCGRISTMPFGINAHRSRQQKLVCARWKSRWLLMSPARRDRLLPCHSTRLARSTIKVSRGCQRSISGQKAERNGPAFLACARKLVAQGQHLLEAHSIIAYRPGVKSTGRSMSQPFENDKFSMTEPQAIGTRAHYAFWLTAIEDRFFDVVRTMRCV